LEQNNYSIADSHIHIGYFERNKRKYYFDPIVISKELESIGIVKWAVMSTTICKGYDAFEESNLEIDTMINYAKDSVYPVLWFLPVMLKKDISYIFNRHNWCAVKIHPRAQFWDPKGRELQESICCIKERNLPIIIHTALYPNYCEAGDFEYLISSNKDVTFILAHGRPIDQAINMVLSFKNVFLDSSYMPYEDINALFSKNLTERVLFGSDYPIDTIFYPDEDRIDRYKTYISKCSNFFSGASFCDNFNILFERNKNILC
jgi:hypothetical protein